MSRDVIEVVATVTLLVWLGLGIRKSYRMNKRPPKDES